MAHRHLMAVCVVCLLCAEHLPCKHVAATTSNDVNLNDDRWPDTPTDYNSLVQFAEEEIDNPYDKRKGEKIKDQDAFDLEIVRQKRHADHHAAHHKHHHNIEMPEVTKNFIQKIFRQFNEQPQPVSMNNHGFESMIKQLNLNHIFNASRNDKMCMDEEIFLKKITHHGHEEEEEDEDRDHDHTDNGHHHHDHIDITSENMLSMCPILLYYAINRDSSLCLQVSNFSMIDMNNEEGASMIVMEDRKLVWLYSTLSIILVSLCGLFGVAVIPIMEKHFYHHILQFLVALAVGTLAGDALLHLLPHAMLPLSDDQDLHHTMMYRGLAAMLGIVFFYFFERFMVLVMEWRQKKEKRDKPSSRVRVMRDPETVSLNGVTTCKHKYSSYPYCYDEIAMETKDDHHEHQHVEEDAVLNNHRDLKITSASDMKKINGMIHDNSNDIDNTTLTLSTSLDDGSIESNALCNNNKQTGNLVSNTTTNAKGGESIQEENYTIILREHQSKHHGHSHTHGHVHSPPESLSAVAWMVIMGDGLHNFTDGMAIGAAFSNNIAGGFSTAVAVFCHELPHELGDFAVLLKAGMSPKKAVYYNLLSSVLCFFGMCVGIMIGDTPEASQWIFAVAAGLFIYIALVDMMPELTSSHGKEENCMLTQFFLQFTGMCTGFLCMLLIAVYEHDLKEIFSS